MLTARIVILNYNGKELLSRCLPSFMEAVRYAQSPTRITVLDNRSSDEGIAWVKSNFPAVDTVISKENRFLVSFNDYLAQIDEEIAILMNNDIRVDPHFIDPLMKVFETHPDAFLASSQCFSFDGSAYQGGKSCAKIRWGLFWSKAIEGEAGRNQDGYTFASGYGAFHRKRFLELGGFDDLYLPGIIEDADLGFRAWRRGFRSYYVPKSRIYHIGQESFKKAFGEKGIQTLAHRNTFLFMWKNCSDPSIFAEHFLCLIPRLLFFALRGKFEFIRGLSQALSRLNEATRRRESLEKRAWTDRQLLRLASGEAPAKRKYLFKSRWKRIAAMLFDAAGILLLKIGRNKKGRSFRTPNKILLVRIDSLGDGILTLPAIHSLMIQFPKAEVHMLVSRTVQSLYSLFFPKARFHLVESDWLDSPSYEEFRKIKSEFKKIGFDLGVDFRGDLRTLFTLDRAKVRHRWGRAGTGGGFLLTRNKDYVYGKHEIIANLELVNHEFGEKVRFPDFQIATSEKEGVENWLLPHTDKKKLLIHPAAGYVSKRWKMDRFVSLIKRINAENLGVPILIGTEDEKKMLPLDSPGGALKTLDLRGQTSLASLLHLMSRSDLFIGNDSGPSHLAALAGCPQVIIFSGTNDYRQWAPWSDKQRLILHPVPCSPCEEKICPLNRQICLEEIAVEEVFRAVKEILQG